MAEDGDGAPGRGVRCGAGGAAGAFCLARLPPGAGCRRGAPRVAAGQAAHDLAADAAVARRAGAAGVCAHGPVPAAYRPDR